MKHFKTLLLLLVLCMTNVQLTSAQDTTNVSISNDALLKVCEPNHFEATFTASDTVRISIAYGLDFGNNAPINTCGNAGSGTAPQILLMIDSSSLNLTDIYHDTTNHIFTATFPFSNNDTCILRYKIFIDCSVIGQIQDSSNITLKFNQEWIDSSANVIFRLNGNPKQEISVVKPYLLATNNNIFYPANYLDTIPLTFTYKNTGQAPVSFVFSFLPDTNEYCHRLPAVDLKYKTSPIGIDTSFLYTDSIAVYLDIGDSLIITQTVIDTLCVICDTLCDCERTAILTWRCDNAPGEAGLFCQECQNEIISNYTFVNADPTNLSVERKEPSDVNFYDNTCVNDTNGVQWEYHIVHAGGEALDSLIIDLVYPNHSDSPENLTLLPQSGISTVFNCQICTFEILDTLRQNALCSQLVQNPLESRRMVIRNLMENDTIILRFKTFQCAEENDSLLLNTPKYFNNWQIQTSGRTICGTSRNNFQIPISQYYIGNYNLHQQLLFFPSVTDLSMQPGETFGDSAEFSIDLKDIVIPGNETTQLQIFGANVQNPNSFDGWLRATIHCQQGLRVQDPLQDIFLLNLNGTPDTIRPDHFYDQVAFDQCVEGDFYTYFRLNDSSVFNALQGGKFIFQLQACCGVTANPPATQYTVTFHILPDVTVDSCFTLTFLPGDTLPPVCNGAICNQWIPLSRTGNQIFTHCPGCKAPGMIVDKYKMQRSSFGLKDSNNDGIADQGLSAIDSNYTFFNLLTLSQSTFGDQLSDKLWAHFQVGDPGAGGYTYSQMLSVDSALRLPYLQLLRTIPAGIDTMNLNIQGFTLYIDAAFQGTCLDCAEYLVPDSIYSTLLAIKVSGAALNNYVDIDTAFNRWLFTFPDPTVPGSTILDSAIYTDSSHPFTGYFENQRMRLKVDYSVCGNFLTPPLLSIQQDDVIITSEIMNKMWLCGQKLSLAIVDPDKQMLNTIAELDSIGITLDSNNTTLALMDTGYTFNRQFYCETYGGLHFFLSQGMKNVMNVFEASGCDYLVQLTSTASRGGFNELNRNYPYEYVPCAVEPDSFILTIPQGFYLKKATINGGTYTQSNNTGTFQFFPSTPVTIPLIDSTGIFTIRETDIPTAICTDKDSFPLAAGDTGFYLSSGCFQRTLSLLISPLSCNDSTLRIVDSLVVTWMGESYTACLNTNNGCSSLPADSSLAIKASGIIEYNSYPNLLVQTNTNGIFVSNSTICIRYTFTNEPNGNPNRPPHAASFVYINTDTSSSLTGWHFIIENGSTPNDTVWATNGVLAIDSTLPVGSILSGRLCTSINNCNQLDTLRIQTGWNCEGFPVNVQDSACGSFQFSYPLTYLSCALTDNGKQALVDTIRRCDTLRTKTVFTSTQAGFVYPLNIDIIDTITGLEIVAVYMMDACAGGSGSVLLPFDTLTQNYMITPALLDSLQNPSFSDHAISSGECLTIVAEFRIGCDYATEDSSRLPDITLHALTYCDSAISSTATHNNNSITIQGSHCTNCFTVTKTVSQNPVPAGDTIQFFIEICANNALPQVVYIVDSLPANFVQTSTINLLPYTTDTIPANGCATTIISGYFQQQTTCWDTAGTNVVRVYGGTVNNLYEGVDSVCVEVTNPCSTANTVVIPDGTYSSALGTTSLNNSQIYISGTFFIDQSISFNFCQILMAAGAAIQVQGNAQLTLHHTQITACDSMWQGIRIEYNGEVFLEDSCLIADAHVAINAGPKGTVKIIRSELINNHIGLEISPLYPDLFAGLLYLHGARFGMNAPFRPDYPHQPAHGKKSFAGMLLHDAVLNIGSNSLEKNFFFGMNNGIRAYRSSLNVYNTAFTDIQLVPFYHNGSNENGAAISIVGDHESEQVTPSYLRLHPNPDGSPNVTNSRCGVYAAITTTEVQNCLLDSVEYGIDEQFLDIGIFSTLINNTIHASKYGIRLMENDGSDYILVEGNTIEMIGNEKSAVGIYAGESYARHTTSYAINSNQVQIANATAGIQTAGVSNASLSYNTIALQNPGTYTAPSTTGIDIGGGAGNFLSCNHVSGHTVTDSLRYGYRVTQSPFDSLNCNVADSVGYSFRFEGAACMGTRLKGNYMGNAYCGLYLNSEAIIGQQPQIGTPPFHGNIWLDSSRYGSGYGAVNLNDASPQTLFNSLFTTNINISAHNPLIPLNSSSAPFYVNDDGWFDPQNSGGSFDCSRSNVCLSAIQDTGDLPPDEQLRMRVVNDSNVSSLFIPESKQIASQLIYADLKSDSSVWNISAYADFLTDKESLSEGLLYKSDSVAYDLRTDRINRNLVLVQLLDQMEILSDSLMITDSTFLQNNDSLFVQQKELMLIQLKSIKEQINTWHSKRSLIQTNGNAIKGQLNQALVAQQIPDANQKEVDRISLLYKQNGTAAIFNNYASLLQVALQCPSSGGPSVFSARNLVRLVNDSMLYDDESTCSQMGILRLATQQLNTHQGSSFAVVPNPASTEITILLDQQEERRYLLQIYNSMGEIVVGKDANMINNLQVSISSIPNGLYTIRLTESNGNSMSSKLVIIR